MRLRLVSPQQIWTTAMTHIVVDKSNDCSLPQYQSVTKSVTHWREQRCLDSNRQRQISQSDCEISSNCGKKNKVRIHDMFVPFSNWGENWILLQKEKVRLTVVWLLKALWKRTTSKERKKANPDMLRIQVQKFVSCLTFGNAGDFQSFRDFGSCSEDTEILRVTFGIVGWSSE